MKDMTNKEAIEWIKAHHDFEMDCQDSQAMRHAIKALEAQESSSWIPVKTRELTAEEKEEHPDCTFMWDCPLPDDAQDVLITTIWGDVQPCTFCVDDKGSYFDEVDYWDFVLAWMPLPKPYKKEETT